MSDSQRLVIRKRNPGMFQSDDEIRKQFVVREHELAMVMETLRGNIDADSCQHTLVVAPKGRGKTMLLARVATELRTNPRFSPRLLPVRFMEENDEVFSVADFWLEALSYLALAIDKQQPEFARNLRTARADLASRWRERELDERARAAVLEAAARLGKRLVLMVENLQALHANVDGSFGWQLRKTLQTEPRIILVATATSRFEWLDDSKEPFFELFRIIALAPLDTAQCRRLWEVVSGDAASERQMRALEILTGGSPRFLVIVAEFARHRSLRQLMEDLVQLIDDLTDTFRGYLETLSKTERRVFLAVADLWNPSSTGEVAARARMDVRTVSTMLGRLVERGAVTYEGSGMKRAYAANERLYRIYYKLRRERDEAAVVQDLLHFMTGWYNEEETAELFGTLALEALESPAILAGIERAHSELPHLRALTSDIARNARTLIATAVEKIERAEYQEAISECDKVMSGLAASKATELQELVMQAYTRKGLAQGRGGDSHAAIETNRMALSRFGASDAPELQHQIAIAFYNIGVEQIRMGDLSDAIATCDQVVVRFGDIRNNEVLVLAAKCLINEGSLHGQLDDRKSEMEAYHKLIRQYGETDVPELQIEVATALFNTGLALARLGKHLQAIAVCDQVVERYGTSDRTALQSRVARTLINKGVEQAELGMLSEAIKTLDSIDHRYGGREEAEMRCWVAQSLAYKAAMQDRIGDSQAAISTSDRTVLRFGAAKEEELHIHVAGALLQKGASLGGLGRHSEAIAASEEVVARVGERDDAELQALVARAMNNKAVSQALSNDASSSIDTIDALVSRFGISEEPETQMQVATALFHKGMTQVRIGRANDARLTADQISRCRQPVAHAPRISFDWKARYVRMSAELATGRQTVAIDGFCSLYAAFASENETMIPELIEAVSMLVAGGVPALQIIGVLRSDPEKAACLAPLVIALRQLSGEVVRAPAETLDVAADVRKRIEETEPLPKSRTPEKHAMEAKGSNVSAVHRELPAFPI